MKKTSAIMRFQLSSILLSLAIFIIPSTSMATYIIKGSAQYEEGATVEWTASIAEIDLCTPFCISDRLDGPKINLDSYNWDYIPPRLSNAESFSIVWSEGMNLGIFDDNSNLLDGFTWRLRDAVEHQVKYDYIDEYVYAYHIYIFGHENFELYNEDSRVPATNVSAISTTSTIIAQASIPEPTTILLLGAGLLGLAGSRRLKK